MARPHGIGGVPHGIQPWPVWRPDNGLAQSAHSTQPACDGKSRGHDSALAIGRSNSPVRMRSGLGEKVEHGEEGGVVPVHHLSPQEAVDEWWRRKGARWRCRLGGVDEVDVLVPYELHGILGWLLVAEGGPEGVSTRLPTMARCQWRTTAALCVHNRERNRVSRLHNGQQLLREEVEAKPLTER
jgi:hypothetical protein